MNALINFCENWYKEFLPFDQVKYESQVQSTSMALSFEQTTGLCFYNITIIQTIFVRTGNFRFNKGCKCHLLFTLKPLMMTLPAS